MGLSQFVGELLDSISEFKRHTNYITLVCSDHNDEEKEGVRVDDGGSNRKGESVDHAAAEGE